MTHQDLFDASYLIAARNFGYLWANGAIKKTDLGMTEAQFEQHIVAELARQVRELMGEIGKGTHLEEFATKYGLESVAAAIEWDLRGRGKEWEHSPLADQLRARIEATKPTSTF